jgi:putative copper export protein
MAGEFAGIRDGDLQRHAWMSGSGAAHLLIVAFWFGALAPLYWVTHCEALDHAAGVVAGFSAIAGWLVPGILVAGLALALVLLLMALAAHNKWRLTPVLSAGAATALPKLRRSIAAEYVLVVVVLVLTAVLTAFFSPES